MRRISKKDGIDVKIVDISEKYYSLYFCCLDDWSKDFDDAGDHKEKWFHRLKDSGLGIKLAFDDDEEAGAMIQYLPIEHSTVIGKDLYFIPCIWVHGHKKGRGNFQKRGMGSALLKAAEEDAKTRGAKGMAAWGIGLPFWMKASWYKKHGYKKADKIGMRILLWKSFGDDAEPPRWIQKKKDPELVDGKITVTSFINGWCPVMNLGHERAKKASEELGDKVYFKEIHTGDPKLLHEWGIIDALYVDKKEVSLGPPPSYEKIKKIIQKKIKKLPS